MREIIIDGATSSLSQEIIHVHLNNNIKVHAIIRPNSLRKTDLLRRFNNICLHEIDANEYSSEKSVYFEDVKSADTFFAFAWSGVSDNFNNDANRQANNILNTLHAVEMFSRITNTNSFEDKKTPKFIFAGSQAELGRGVRDEKPIDPYGICKLTVGKLAKHLAYEKSIDYIHTRIFTTYGLKNRTSKLLDYIIPKFLKNETVNLTKCEQNWDFLHYKDAAQYYYHLGKSNNVEPNEIYEIGSGKGQILQEWIKTIAKLCHTKSQINFGVEPYHYAQKGLDFVANVENLQRVTSYAPKIRFEDGIKEVIEYYRSLL